MSAEQIVDWAHAFTEDWFDDAYEEDEIEAAHAAMVEVKRLTPLVLALPEIWEVLQQLLICTELNMDDMEPATVALIEQGRYLLEKTTC